MMMMWIPFMLFFTSSITYGNCKFELVFATTKYSVVLYFRYIYLSNNEKTGFKSRELKSVHIDAEGQYIRLVIHKNHINKFNVYNQVMRFLLLFLFFQLLS